jgi:hypothetical protein
MSKTALKALLTCYLMIGLLWSATFGMYTLSLKSETGDKEFYDYITSVTSAMLKANGHLVLCVQGYRETREKPGRPPDAFELTIPVVEVIEQPEEAKKKGFAIWWDDWLFVPRTWVKDSCTFDPTATKVPVVVMSGNEPSEFFDGLDDAQFAGLTLPAGHRQAIFVAPVSSNSATFNFYKEVAYLGKTDATDSRKAYTIHIAPHTRNNPVSAWRWPIAIASDALMWPVQILMRMNYAKSH